MSSGAAPHEVEYLRDRVRLYLQVLLAIDVGCTVASWLLELFIDELKKKPAEATPWPPLLMSTIAAGWALAKFRRPARGTLIGLESAITIGHGLAFIPMVRHAIGEGNLTPLLGAPFVLLGILLGLVLRASLVPSSVHRTVAIGVASVAGMYLAERTPDAIWLALMGFCFVVVTAVTSHVIYGLRRQVRDAMRLGQYTLEEKLGEGGMGEVYRARHSRLRRSTAIKLLPASRSSEQAVARFESEVQLTAGLTHPNTITIFDYGRTEDGIFYYAMEYLRGATLEQVVDADGPQPAARVIRILEQAAGALQEAHAAGLIHRDIKPANVMLTRQGLDPDAVKVLDFGLVRPIEGEQNGHLTRDGDLVGTPLYMAPEMITSQEAAGPASDLYALGAVGYFLLTGTHVFAGATLIEMCSHHLHTAPEAISDRLGKPVSHDLESLVLQCLSKRPADRPATASALIARLAQCQDRDRWSAQDAESWWTRCRDALDRRRSTPPSARAASPAVLTVITTPSQRPAHGA
jgi:serine/threonine-protein kinase